MPTLYNLFTFLTIIASLGSVTNGKLISKRRESTLYLFGDSTMATCRYGPVYGTETSGWGTPLASYLSLPVVNNAKSGWSARQAHREKLYDSALASAQPGDSVIIQWGRNDVFSPNEATLQKRPCDPVGDNFDTVCKGPSSNEPEIFTFVKYLVMAAETFQAKGVHVIIASLTTKSTFQDPSGQFKEEESKFIDWAKTAAELSGSSYIDLHASMTRWYKRLGAAEVKTCYLPITPGKPDFTHTTRRGAEVAARSFIGALKNTDIALKSFVKSTPSKWVTPACQ